VSLASVDAADLPEWSAMGRNCSSGAPCHLIPALLQPLLLLGSFRPALLLMQRLRK